MPRKKQTYPTSVVAWDKGNFIGGILKIDVELLEDLLDRYDDGHPDTVDEYDEGKACIYFTLNVPDDPDDTMLGSASLDNPINKKRKEKSGRKSRRN